MISKMVLGACVSVMALGLAACGGTEPAVDDEVVGSTSEAVQSADGPFSSTAALAAYWAAQSTGGAAVQIFVNGHKVYDCFGFGPAFTKEYFDCADGSGINAVCTGSLDGYAPLNSAYNQFTGWTIYVDGTLKKSGDARGVYLKTCTGDTSFYGPVKYYVVVGFSGLFSPLPPFRSDCYP